MDAQLRSPEGGGCCRWWARGRCGSYTPEHARLFAQLMVDRRRYAPPFYAMSWSFVDFTVAEVGKDCLRAIATADDPDAAARQRGAQTLQQLKHRWLVQRGVAAAAAAPTRVARSGGAR
ncbi:MAG: hypothetical protein ACREO8_11350 [Luteimonas sp.]